MLSEQIVSSPVCRSAFEGVGPHAGSTLTLWFSGRSQRGPSRIRTRTRTRSKPWACSRMRPSSARTRPQVRLALCTLHFLVSPLGLHKAQHTSQTHLASLGCKHVFHSFIQSAALQDTFLVESGHVCSCEGNLLGKQGDMCAVSRGSKG